MKSFRYLLPLLALVVTAHPLAHADTVLLGSYGTMASNGTTAVNPGVINSAAAYGFSSSMVNTASTTTYNLNPQGSVWLAALPNSSWVSFNPDSAPGGSYVAPNGDYIYTVTFFLSPTLAGGVGSISVMADDTLSVTLNNNLLLAAAGPLGSSNTYAKCSDVAPNCSTPTLVNLNGLVAGNNVLTFDVKQVNMVNQGFDFSGSITAVPEPGSLALFGTGLVSVMGFARRFKR